MVCSVCWEFFQYWPYCGAFIRFLPSAPCTLHLTQFNLSQDGVNAISAAVTSGCARLVSYLFEMPIVREDIDSGDSRGLTCTYPIQIVLILIVCLHIVVVVLLV